MYILRKVKFYFFKSLIHYQFIYHCRLKKNLKKETDIKYIIEMVYLTENILQSTLQKIYIQERNKKAVQDGYYLQFHTYKTAD